MSITIFTLNSLNQLNTEAQTLNDWDSESNYSNAFEEGDYYTTTYATENRIETDSIADLDSEAEDWHPDDWTPNDCDFDSSSLEEDNLDEKTPIVPYIAPVAPWANKTTLKVDFKSLIENDSDFKQKQEKQIECLFEKKKNKPSDGFEVVSNKKRKTAEPVIEKNHLKFKACSFGNKCTRGNKCTFAHSLAELDVNACAFDLNCKHGDACKFMHSNETLESFALRSGNGSLLITPETEVKQVEKKQLKLKACTFLLNCKRGTKCTFAHSLAELDVRECLSGRKCKKGSACLFKHPNEKLESYALRTGNGSLVVKSKTCCKH